ncbi:glycosyl hydrolase 115 family protein [Fulvivirga sediminis]|uniref:Glycosyl hydrolase 115 family protein n=1 Tax=Fulvivirga sediminis TaxID=2803949 RepID=A0A937FC34_9BACT|nr:glycosyl hydrolase 115 family protein [Fulvivirga sediminis]MBL3658942.1 glycosyl hydrolase 115 family protein [Fulvivirga sediminis]
MKRYLILSLLTLIYIPIFAQSNFPSPQDSYVSTTPDNAGFPLISQGKAVPIYISSEDFKGVQEVAQWFQADLKRVSGDLPQLNIGKKPPKTNRLVIAGTLGHNAVIDKLVKSGRIDVSKLKDQWEHFLIQTVKKPSSGVDEALVIVGSDKRGTIYGMLDISEKMGVSPWYWWADVPAKQHQDIYITKGFSDAPKVKYRGIFINDEAPALSGWAHENFGSFNHKFYGHVFELILRMKGNYLWPAMWGRSIYDDDSLSAPLANKLGVVIGMSHHEPLMRAHIEWKRYGNGPWDYSKNKDTLQKFWRDGMERMGDNESIVTIAMRGDGDEPMSEESNIQLLETIVQDQRAIIEEVTGKPAKETPQLWALYKEVQDYYDKGMRVPDDVTLLLCDDNWGNIRKLPALSDSSRSGGYGIYYHYDYVGGPRNYKWLNTNQISRTWEQMNLAYNYNADRIWIVNVGDIKPMEFPISFFLDYAWDPTLPASELPSYTKNWAAEQFGKKYQEGIAHILEKYTKYNSRRKPELLSPETYNIENGEFEKVVKDYNELVQQADSINGLLPDEYKAAYFQLVLYPVKASANLNELYYTVALNHYYAEQGRITTDSLIHEVKALFDKDQLLADQYHQLLGGKWNHIMNQTHIGYTNWYEPKENILPETKSISSTEKPEMGVALQGETSWWPKSNSIAELSPFNSFNKNQKYYIEIFNRGKTPFDFSLSSDHPWVKISNSKGTIHHQKRIWISINWEELKENGNSTAIINVTGANEVVSINVTAFRPHEKELEGFIEENGTISIEADSYSKAINTEGITWTTIPNLGRTSSSVSAMPVTKAITSPGGDSPHLEYDIHLFEKGEIKLTAYFSPTLAFHNHGRKYAISIDDQQPKIINMHENENGYTWSQAVSNNVRKIETSLQIGEKGKHTIKFWLVDPGVVLQKIVVNTSKDSKENYLGPSETKSTK